MRNPFSFIFGKRREQREQRERSALEQYTSRISMESFLGIYCTSPAGIRLASAVSVNALFWATHMVGGIVKHCSTFQKRMGGGGRRIEWKDAALFEAVAYCHGYLEYCGGKERSTASSSPDPIYDDAMQLASAITGDIVARDMVPRVSKNALALRVEQYVKSFDQGIQNTLEEVEFTLAQAFVYGDTPGWRTGPPVLDFALGEAVSMMVKIEQATALGALIDVSRILHAKGDELLREWNTRAP